MELKNKHVSHAFSDSIYFALKQNVQLDPESVLPWKQFGTVLLTSNATANENRCYTGLSLPNQN